MSFKTILIEKKDQITKITLNLPEKRNALDMVMRVELLHAMRDISDDEDVKAVVLTGAGKAFCSGGDLRTMENLTAVAGRIRMKKGQRLIKAMIELEKPIIAAVNGPAAGPGVSIALASDFLIASESAKFAIPFVKVGLVPDWGLLYFLPLRIGIARAKEFMILGKTLDAREADLLGLVNKVVPPEELEGEAFALASKLAKGPLQCQAMIKSALNHWPASLDSLLEMESSMQAVAFSSEDFIEGRQAFLESRKPDFKGE
ncbi:enoyl-CoA hydratase/isomerase family protein [Thermodesulfobacteriota bacterium]